MDSGDCSGMSQKVIDELLTVLDEEHAYAVFEHRTAKKAKLTPYAAKLLAKQFALCPDPNEAADQMILHGWQGFRADWIGARPKPEREEVDVRFRELWESYPIDGSENYAKALETFNREIRQRDDVDFIIQAAKWTKASLPEKFDPTYAERRQFLPSLHKWLHEERFEAKRAVWDASQAFRKAE